MVLLHVKRGDESQFLLQAPGSTELEELTVQVARIYNARLKVQRLCSGGPRGAASLGGRDCGARARAGWAPGPRRAREGEETEPFGTEGVGRDPQGFLRPPRDEFANICRYAVAGLEMGHRGSPEMHKEPARKESSERGQMRAQVAPSQDWGAGRNTLEIDG